MYVCMVTHIARVWIDPGKVANPARGQLNISLSAFAPENLVLRDGFGSPVPRRRPCIYFKPPYSISPEFIGSRNCVPMAFIAESPPAQGQ